MYAAPHWLYNETQQPSLSFWVKWSKNGKVSCSRIQGHARLWPGFEPTYTKGYIINITLCPKPVSTKMAVTTVIEQSMTKVAHYLRENESLQLSVGNTGQYNIRIYVIPQNYFPEHFRLLYRRCDHLLHRFTKEPHYKGSKCMTRQNLIF